MITVTAKTLDEAITKAAIELGTSSDNLDYTIIEEKAGFLGFGKAVTIKAGKKQEDDLDALYASVVSGKEEKKPAPAPKQEKKAEKEPKKEGKDVPQEKTVKEAEKTEKAKDPVKEQPKEKDTVKEQPKKEPQNQKKEQKKEKKDNYKEFKTEFKTESKYEVKSMKPRENTKNTPKDAQKDAKPVEKPAQKEAQAPKDKQKNSNRDNLKNSRKDYGRDRGRDSYRVTAEEIEAEREAQRIAEEKRAEKERERKENRKPVDVPVCKAAAEDFLNQVFGAMGMTVAMETVYDEEEFELIVNLEGDDMGILIGKRGQTLDSLQYLVSLVVNKKTEGYLRVKLDTENYRARRKETLEALAKNIAYKVKRTRRSVSLEPMNPYERRIIHSTLQNDRYVVTRSEGEDPYRHVVVSLKREVREKDRRGGYSKQNGQNVQTDSEQA